MEHIAYGEPVVVGVDGSEVSARALDWAVAEADRRGAPLRIVHAWLWPLYNVPLGPAPGAPPGAGLRAEAERILAQAEGRARRQSPGRVITSDLVVGSASTVMIDASRDAGLVVVGSRGLGGFAGLLLGSVGVHLAAHAVSPVVIVRGEAAAQGPIVVGVDGSSCSERAVAAAFEVASMRKAPLTAVHAYGAPELSVDVGRGWDDVVHAGEREARAVLASAVEMWTDKYPDVAVRQQLVAGPASRALVEASRGAQLLVVGSRGRGSFTGLALGSVSHAAVHHAGCPVMVCRAISPPDAARKA